jgi:G3E family GTPase
VSYSSTTPYTTHHHHHHHNHHNHHNHHIGEIRLAQVLKAKYANQKSLFIFLNLEIFLFSITKLRIRAIVGLQFVGGDVVVRRVDMLLSL